MSSESKLPQARYQAARGSFRARDFLHKCFALGVFPGYTGPAGKEDPASPCIGHLGFPLRMRDVTAKNWLDNRL